MANAEPNVAAYELQERCAKSAVQAWTKYYDNGNYSQGNISYQAHYNSRLNKCFFLEMRMTVNGKNDVWNGLSLFDLLENKEYGGFTRSTLHGVVECRMQDVFCDSEDEWRQLAKQFLED